MADIFKKHIKNFPPNPINKPHHCRPNINININNEDNDSGSSISPLILELINRINKVENDIGDFNDLPGVNLQLGESEGQAYPGERGRENTLDIHLLKNNVSTLQNDVDLISGELIYKADKNEIPKPEIYYVTEFQEVPSISGIYIKGKETKFWSGSEWFDISLKTSLNVSNESTDEEVPTAKAVYNILDKYATDEEVSQIVRSVV